MLKSCASAFTLSSPSCELRVTARKVGRSDRRAKVEEVNCEIGKDGNHAFQGPSLDRRYCPSERFGRGEERLPNNEELE